MVVAGTVKYLIDCEMVMVFISSYLVYMNADVWCNRRKVMYNVTHERAPGNGPGCGDSFAATAACRTNRIVVRGFMTSKTCSKGFTLTELLVVITVIAILSLIAIPQFNSYRAKSYNAAAVSDMRNFMAVMEGFYHDIKIYPTL
jgi:type IV pilus assembly protein PilA